MNKKDERNAISGAKPGFKSTPSKHHEQFWRWRHHYHADVIIVTPGKNVKNFKYCAILLNMLHTGGLCRVLRFTAPLSFYMSNL